MQGKKSFVLGMLTLPLVLAGVTAVVASTATIPHTFSSGGPALASEVNANFSALKTAIDDNDSRLGALESSGAATRYLALTGMHFHPSNPTLVSSFQSSTGIGGFYATAGVSAIVAPVELPHDALITRFTVYFNDTNSNADVQVTLVRQFFGGSGFGFVSPVITSDGDTGNYSRTTTALSPARVNNQIAGYAVRAYSDDWSTTGATTVVLGALIEYTLP